MAQAQEAKVRLLGVVWVVVLVLVGLFGAVVVVVSLAAWDVGVDPGLEGMDEEGRDSK